MDLLKGFIYPLFSQDFYRQVLHWSVGRIIAFIVLFSLTLTIIGSLWFWGRTLLEWGDTFSSSVIQEAIEDYLQDLDFTYLQYDHSTGELTTDLANQPYLEDYQSEDGESVIAVLIDTTGSTSRIPTVYKQGVLVGEDYFVVRDSSGADQLYYYHQIFTDDFYYTKGELIQMLQEWVDQLWGTLVIMALVMVFVLVPLFKFLAILFKYVVFMLLVGGLLSLFIPRRFSYNRFGQGIALAVVLFVPVYYLQTFLNQGIALLPDKLESALCFFTFSWVPLLIVLLAIFVFPVIKELRED